MRRIESIASSLPDEVKKSLHRPLTRRDFVIGSLLGAASLTAGTQQRKLNVMYDNIEDTAYEFIYDEIYPNNEFLKDATPLTQEEIKTLSSDHNEFAVPFMKQPKALSSDSFSFSVTGNGSPNYLTIPGQSYRDPRLSVFDIVIDDEKVRRVALVSSANAPEKVVQLGVLENEKEHTVQVIQRFDGREDPYDMYRMTGEISVTSVQSMSLRRIIDDGMPYVLPRRVNEKEDVWNDIPVEFVAVPYIQDENLRILYVKKSSAEDSRFRTLFHETGRTYDEDWLMKSEITPSGEYVDGYVQKKDHRTGKYKTGRFIDDTHPVVEIYTKNGMVRGEWGGFSQSTPHFAERPTIIAAKEYNASFMDGLIDVNLQGISIQELLREEKINDGDEIVLDFTKRFVQSAINEEDK